MNCFAIIFLVLKMDHCRNFCKWYEPHSIILDSSYNCFHLISFWSIFKYNFYELSQVLFLLILFFFFQQIQENQLILSIGKSSLPYFSVTVWHTRTHSSRLLFNCLYYNQIRRAWDMIRREAFKIIISIIRKIGHINVNKKVWE